MTYKVHIYETSKFELEVEANSPADAMNIAMIEHIGRDPSERNDCFMGITDRRTHIPPPKP